MSLDDMYDYIGAQTGDFKASDGELYSKSDIVGAADMMVDNLADNENKKKVRIALAFLNRDKKPDYTAPIDRRFSKMSKIQEAVDKHLGISPTK